MTDLGSIAGFGLALRGRGLPRPVKTSTAADSEFYFRLIWQGKACCLITVDKKSKEVTPFHGCFTGVIRTALQEFTHARSRDALQFGWDEDLWEGAHRNDYDEFQDEVEPAHLPPETGGVILSRHPSLVRSLFSVPNLQGPVGQLIRVDPNLGKLVVVLHDGADESLLSHIEWRDPRGNGHILKDPLMIAEDALLDGNILRRIEPLGIHFSSISEFPASMKQAEAPLALSLLLSALPNVEIEREGFSVEKEGTVELRSVAVFQMVDNDGALVLQTKTSLPGFEPELLEQFDFSRIVRIDDAERVLHIAEVDSTKNLLAMQSLVQSLAKIDRQERSQDSYWRDLENGSYLLGPGLAKVFLRDHLGSLASQFELFGAEKLRKYRIVYRSPTVRMRLGAGVDFFEGEATLDFGGELIDIWKAITQYKKERYIRLSDGTQAVVDPSYMARLERLLKKSKSGVRVSFFDMPMIEDLLAESAEFSSIPSTREFFLGMNRLAERKVSTRGFTGTLREYQVAGLKWIDYLHEHGFGGCLADDMGLGKTVQAIALLVKICSKAKNPTLIVMPRSLLFNWERELKTFAPGLRAGIYHETRRDWDAALDNDIILTTYGTMRSDIEKMSATEFHAVLLDESQAIKNIESQTAKAACLLRARFRLALSGTPVENNLGELYALFRFLNPGMFPVKAEFERQYVQPIQQGGDSEAAAELRRKIHPFLLRRLKQDVLKDLPPKIEQTLLVEMTREQEKLYTERREFFRQWIHGEIESKGFKRSQLVILEAILELRQIATVPESKTDGEVKSSKCERLLDAIEEVVSNGRKCLVFSNFLAGVEQVASMLDEAGIRHVSMTGMTSNRQELVESFQHDPRIKAFVMTLKTGGVGLNLTAADTVFLLDPWWNTSAEAQAVDRTHRIGQTNTVFTYRLIAKGTIEEKILELQAQKRALVDSIISSDGSALKELAEEDIDLLFQA